jgi:hypothetical protein
MPWWVDLLNDSLASSAGWTLVAFVLVDMGSALMLWHMYALVGPARCCSPCHPTPLEPSFLSQSASFDVASNICQALNPGRRARGRQLRAGIRTVQIHPSTQTGGARRVNYEQIVG